MDDAFAEFFERNARRLEDSIVIVFSDHGNRYDTIRETVTGRLESRLIYYFHDYIRSQITISFHSPTSTTPRELSSSAKASSAKFEVYDDSI